MNTTEKKFLKIAIVMIIISLLIFLWSFLHISIEKSRNDKYSVLIGSIDYNSSQENFANSVKNYLDHHQSKPFVSFIDSEKVRIIIANLSRCESLLIKARDFASFGNHYSLYQEFVFDIISYPFPVIPSDYYEVINRHSSTTNISEGLEIVADLITEQVNMTMISDDLKTKSENTINRLKAPEAFYRDIPELTKKAGDTK